MFGDKPPMPSFHPDASIAQSWQRRGRHGSSSPDAEATSLPALRDRSLGVKRRQNPKHWGGGGCFETLGWKEDKPQTLGVSRLLPHYIRCKKKDVIEEETNSLPSSSPISRASAGESSRYLRDPKSVTTLWENKLSRLWDSCIWKLLTWQWYT